MIRAYGSTWTEVDAEDSLRSVFGFAASRHAAQVDAGRHTHTASTLHDPRPAGAFAPFGAIIPFAAVGAKGVNAMACGPSSGGP